MGRVGKGLDYLRSIPFILKIFEFVILLIAISTVGHFLDNAEIISGSFKLIGKKGNLQFFVSVVVLGWLLVIAMSVFFISGFHEKVSAINWPLTVAIISATWTLLLLVSSSMVADAARHYESDKVTLTVLIHGKLKTFTITTCDALDKIQSDAECEHLIGGTVCGFVAMVLFALDVFAHFRMYMTRESAPKATPSAVVT